MPSTGTCTGTWTAGTGTGTCEKVLVAKTVIFCCNWHTLASVLWDSECLDYWFLCPSFTVWHYTVRHKNCTLLVGTTLQNYAIQIQWQSLTYRCTWEYLIAWLFDSLCKIENWEPAYQICYCLLSSRQRSKMWNSYFNARPQTSSLQTYHGLLTVLALILWITGYVEYCRNVFIKNLLKTER